MGLISLPQWCSDEEYIKHHESTLPAACKFFGVKNAKSFQREIIPKIINRGPLQFTNVEVRSMRKEDYHSLRNIYRIQI